MPLWIPCENINSTGGIVAHTARSLFKSEAEEADSKIHQLKSEAEENKRALERERKEKERNLQMSTYYLKKER